MSSSIFDLTGKVIVVTGATGTLTGITLVVAGGFGIFSGV